ncbi:tyrosine-type recombinase/integrase [Enterococcus sp. LJL128]
MVQYKQYLTKTGKKRWKYSAYYGMDEKTGERIQIRGQGKLSKAEAKLDYERQLEKRKRKESDKKKIRFKDLLTEYLEYYKSSGIKPGTYKKFKDEMDRYAIPLLGTLYVDQIEIEDCQKAFDELKRKRKDFRKIKNQIKTVLDFGITKQYISSNPMQYILVGKSDFSYKKRRLSSSENFYDPKQLMTFLEAFKEVEEYQKFVYFRLLAFTGLRRGEALALFESDLLRDEKAIDINKTLTEDENGGTFISFSPKTEESKNLVYLDDDTFDYLDKLIKDRNSYDNYGSLAYIHNSKYIFVSPKTKKHYHRSAPNDWLKNFFDRNEDELTKRGLHRISPHGFRHSQATLLYELGVDPKDAQYRLRHKNLKTTMDVYTHLSNRQKRAPILKLDEFSANGAIFGATESSEQKKGS